ncbi:MAG TPA: hypothetical protein VFK85_13735 [Anaeromyxobacteraceae bacterium]|nr:hypothetical protein [Anaeromyxobacteraceae bacterium]
MTSRPIALLLVAAALALAAPSRAAADQAAGCHCFRDRAYDPARPTAADPYILATTRSSTLAAVFGAEKAALIRVVMTGTSADDLWIAHWAGARVGKEPMQLLAAKGAAGAWKKAFAAADRDALGEIFVERLAKNAADADLAAVAVDDVVVSRLRASPDLVHVTRAAGAGSPELILTLLLAPRLKVGPPELLAAVKNGKSWGALLTEAGIAPRDIDDVVKAAVTPAPAQGWLLK